MPFPVSSHPRENTALRALLPPTGWETAALTSEAGDPGCLLLTEHQWMQSISEDLLPARHSDKHTTDLTSLGPLGGPGRQALIPCTLEDKTRHLQKAGNLTQVSQQMGKTDLGPRSV